MQVDASWLEIVLLNLIRNAVKYSNPERAVRWVRIRFRKDEDQVKALWWIEVRDNGLGIHAEHHGQIFERFFRAHPEQAEGTGLGLAIVREAVQQSGGHITLESEPGVGSTFRFSLPRSEFQGIQGREHD